jgi:hypothetical protein
MLVLVALAAAAALWAGAADAALYWTDGGAISGANLDGSGERRISEDPPPPPGLNEREPRVGFACGGGVAVDGTYVYWPRPSLGTIARANIEDGKTEPAFISGLVDPCGVAVDLGHVYWTDALSGTIGRANLEGREVEAEFVGGLGHPCELAVGGGELYWSAKPVGGFERDSYIGREPASGGPVERVYEAEEQKAGTPGCAIAVDSSHIYFNVPNQESIGRVELDGSDPEPGFIPGAFACGLATVGGRLYWTAGEEMGRPILATDLEGSHLPQTVVAKPSYMPCALAADATALRELPPLPVPTYPPVPPKPSPPPPLPTPIIDFGGVRHASRGPAAFVSVYFAQAGTFIPSATTAGEPLGLKVLGGGSRAIHGVESRLLRIGPPRGAAARELLARLRRGRKVRAEVTVKFAGLDGSIETGTRTLNLVEPSPRRR